MMPQILDCTLRDGGYVNNWEFDTETAVAIMNGLFASGVRCIEIGIMGAGGIPGVSTKFSDFTEIEPLLAHRQSGCRYAVMITTENTLGMEVPPHSESTPDIIRLAYFKPDVEVALGKAALYRELGYGVFLQAMATFMYSEEELAQMLERVNALAPEAFYIVDSFSTMYPEDVRAMRDSVLARLAPDIAFGFHAHNNIQMAYANVREFLRDIPADRSIYADSSIFGMGRGAGNVPTELLMRELNRGGASYDMQAVLRLYERYLEPIYRQYGWGYTLPYLLTAVHETNSAYGWYFMNHGVETLDELEAALSRIPDCARYALKRDIADCALAPGEVSS